MSKNIYRVTFKLQSKVKEDMLATIKAEGYGQRGKAKWVSEAILDLIDSEGFLELMAVGLEEPSDLLPDPDGISVSTEVRKRLDDALKKLRLEYPESQSNQSAIVRTAIFQRLIRRRI